ncbi:MAG: molybdenum cofactor biosynthesis protein MoaE [Ignavibacteriae bacterium]|nr:molybdenum cofactor biosynthesis protein MoaE [Ignavibacteriota bacterium]
MIQIVKDKINVEQVIESVADPAAGGVDVFIGTTRNSSNGKQVRFLEYHAYKPMAIKMMHRIVNETRSQWDVKKIALVHREGRLEIGEPSVVIAVSAAHRDEAFKACRYLIDTLKKVVPIWKKEFFEDGEVWVESEERMARVENRK